MWATTSRPVRGEPASAGQRGSEAGFGRSSSRVPDLEKPGKSPARSRRCLAAAVTRRSPVPIPAAGGPPRSAGSGSPGHRRAQDHSEGSGTVRQLGGSQRRVHGDQRRHWASNIPGSSSRCSAWALGCCGTTPRSGQAGYSWRDVLNRPPAPDAVETTMIGAQGAPGSCRFPMSRSMDPSSRRYCRYTATGRRFSS